MKRIAVVGAGISGLGAAWTLAQRGGCHITLMESGDYFGGHANTLDVTLDGKTFGVDTGFLVYNERTYPELIALFDALGVSTTHSNMGFSVQVRTDRESKQNDLEWAGNNLASVFAQKSNLMKPSFWGMLQDLMRFNKLATQLASDPSHAAADESVAAFLTRHKFGAAFRDHYLLPMIACIWSCPTDQMLQFPIRTLLTFCHNHGLLQVNDRPQWFTVNGGSRHYVSKIIHALQAAGHETRLNTSVTGLKRFENSVQIGDETFDAVILATHSNTSLKILAAEATELERQVLSHILYQDNLAVLHTDTSVMPERRAAWAAWNYEHHTDAQHQKTDKRVCLHYWLNDLQPLPTQTPVIVSLNPLREIDERNIIQQIHYDHPVFDAPAIAAQRQLPELQAAASATRTWFAGAWQRYGFHEDGLQSGTRAARAVIEALGL